MKCDTPFEKYSDDVLINGIFKSGIWGVTSISNWQFLIPFYHQNSKEIVLNTFCSNILNLKNSHKPSQTPKTLIQYNYVPQMKKVFIFLRK